MSESAHPKVKIGAKVYASEGEVQSVTVDQDVDQPDMCQVVLRNTSSPPPSSDVNLGDALEIDMGVGGNLTNIFKGEVVAIEPVYEAAGKSQVSIRGFNRLHRLTRGRKSRTFENMSDQDIATKIAQDAKLTPKVGSSPKITYKHVYQHNQTDLEFLLQRASRIDYEVVVTGEKTLEFRTRDLSTDSGITLKLGNPDGDYSLQRVSPRLSSAAQVSEVDVRGWDPQKRKEIVGKAKAAATKMGKTAGGDEGKDVFGSTVTFEVDDRVTSQEEADARAKAILEELLMNYITGEGVAKGTPKLKAGIVVTLDLAPDDRFTGKYYLTAVSHRYAHKQPGGKSGGYTTAFRFKRNAGGK